MKEVTIGSVSDIHLGHRRNPTTRVIKNLLQEFPDSPEMGELDILFIAGDVYDDLLSLPDENVTHIDFWIWHILYVCVKYDIVLRVLDGTKSHDWFQSSRFEVINQIGKINADVKYVRDLSIEYIERYDINVLYVPDEWSETTERTLAQVKELMRAKGLVTVDFAVMHGQFGHQLPEGIKAQKHDSEEYLALVTELIFIGHVHKPSVYKRIIAQGSFDRLSHGEEEAKGHFRVKVHGHHNYDIQFVENKGAMLFKTIDCTSLDLEQTFEKIDSQIGTITDNIHVRVLGDPDNPIFTNMNVLIGRYPFVTWSKLVKDNETITINTSEASEEYEYIPVELTKENLPPMLIERLVSRGVDSKVLHSAEVMLKEFC